ncbi:MAG: PTS sugar transporter subunit IIC [Treponema sp.]|nr:PTS sugar transporter subunit IIC [Treponema sp.]
MNKYVKKYCVDAMSGMAQGLFASLLIGTIIKTLGQQLLRLGTNAVFQFLVDAGNFATDAHVVGAAMAVGIGFAMHVDALVLFSLVAVGSAANITGGAGGPLAVLIIAIIAAEFGSLVSKKTKVDILVTPAVTLLSGALFTVLTAKYIGIAANSVGTFIVWTTKLHPFVMGMIVSAVIGIALTLPISSAAICAAFGLVGLAGGAAVAGCCAQMVGFAVLSFKENRWGGILSQGLGTSMLQMPNIIKNPKVWLPPIITSIITGPIATCLFKIEMNGAAVSSGMGTCGLVGQIGVISGWYEPSEAAIAHGATAINPGFMDWLGVILICFVLPAVICWALGKLFRKIGWIKDGDLSLEQND